VSLAGISLSHSDRAAWDSALDRLEAEHRADDPVGWIRTDLNEHLWSGQQQIAASVVTHRSTAVPAAHGLGKSRSAADIGLWWLATKEDPFLVTTAPTAAQVAAILWREIKGQHEANGLPGRVTMSGYPQLHEGGRLVGLGRKPSDYDESTFQGIHALNVLIVFDEAAGIPAGLWEQAESLMTNSNARMLAIGNPTDPQSQFATVCKPGSGWNVIRLDGLRSPLLTEEAVAPFPLLADLMVTEGIPYSTEDVPNRLRDLLTGPQWIAERITRWGVGSALWLARVRGIFPEEADADAVIPLAWVVQAQDRWSAWNEHRLSPPGRQVHGLDVGRSADADENVLATRHGHVVYELEAWRVKDLEQTTGRAVGKLRAMPTSVAVVDETGIGAGVLDAIRGQGRSAVGFVASGKSEATDRNGEFAFANLRAEAWWRLREALDPAHNPDLCLPPDDQLAADLTAPRWKIVRQGVIQIESKDDIRKRLGRSTDRGDAVVMSMWQSTMAGPEPDVAHWGDAAVDNSDLSDNELVEEWLEQYQ
jgi:hypothetical protein